MEHDHITGAPVVRRREWAQVVRDELEKEELLKENTILVFHTGKDYYGELLPLLEGSPVEVELPTEGLQIGEKLSWEVVQYASDDQTVFVPRIYGQTKVAKASSSTSTSRSGNEYVETEGEMYDDLDKKLRESDLSEHEYQTFIDLYEFAKEIGDNVDISGAKNANFKMQADAHRSNHSGRPSVFTANAGGMLKVWPASMPINGDAPETSPIEWDPAAYEKFKTDFQSLEGVSSDETEVYFRNFCQADNLD